MLTPSVLQSMPASHDVSPTEALLGVPVFLVEPDMSSFQVEVEATWGEVTRTDPFLLDLEAKAAW